MLTGGYLPWGYNTYNISMGIVSVEVLCQVTNRGIEQWPAETHAKLLAAYKVQVQQYEDKMARQKISDGIAIQETSSSFEERGFWLLL